MLLLVQYKTRLVLWLSPAGRTIAFDAEYAVSTRYQVAWGLIHRLAHYTLSSRVHPMSSAEIKPEMGYLEAKTCLITTLAHRSSLPETPRENRVDVVSKSSLNTATSSSLLRRA